MSTVVDTVKYAAEEIRDFFRYSLFSYGGDYTPGPSESEEHAKKIADELAEKKEEIRELTKKDENRTIDYINKSMNDLVKYLEEINNKQFGGKTLNININEIKKSNEKLKKEVVGCLSGYIDERLVLTDNELSIILEERDDKKRKKKFKAFCEKIEQQAFDELSKKIEKTVRKQEEVIRKEIKVRLDEVERNMKTVTKAYDEIVEIKGKDESKMEEAQIKYIYQYELSEILLDQLEG